MRIGSIRLHTAYGIPPARLAQSRREPEETSQSYEPASSEPMRSPGGPVSGKGLRLDVTA